MFQVIFSLVIFSGSKILGLFFRILFMLLINSLKTIPLYFADICKITYPLQRGYPGRERKNSRLFGALGMHFLPNRLSRFRKQKADILNFRVRNSWFLFNFIEYDV